MHQAFGERGAETTWFLSLIINQKTKEKFSVLNCICLSLLVSIRSSKYLSTNEHEWTQIKTNKKHVINEPEALATDK